MRSIAGIVLAAASAVATGEPSPNRIYGADNIKRHLQRKKSAYERGAETSIAQVNRHTGKPHEHKREAARRVRQMAGVA